MATWKDDIGYTQLQAELGAGTPDGQGIKVTQVEGALSGNYMPNVNNAEFTGKTINNISNSSAGASSHATDVGRYFYGSTTSIASGISTVDVYDAANFLGPGMLRPGSNAVPLVETSAIQNHSWVGSTGNEASDIDILRRMDFVINRDNVLVVAGLNNGSATAVPNLMAGMYNGLTVGRSDGQHSTGTTNIDGVGRVRPDIVAPATVTSFATPIVASAGAVLLDAAGSVASADASKTQVVKAVLLAGATKQGEEFSASWSRTHTRPLDEHYGAGEVNIYNSYHIMMAGEQEASNVVNRSQKGWAFQQISSTSLMYFFEVAEGDVLTELSAILTWNRVIADGPGQGFGNLTSTMANLDLRFYSAANFVLGAQLDYSVSDVDNVEHIYQTNLGAGQYALVVEKRDGGQPNTEYALAWSVSTTPIPEPSTTFLVMGTLSVMFLRRSVRRLR